ncbi:MAG: hypothetical protein ACOYYS_03305 [Chloroflexota bacterium]
MTYSKLDRRQFLRAGLVGLALLAFPVGVRAAGAVEGPVVGRAALEALHAAFGTAYTVQHMQRQDGYWYARLAFQGVVVHLKSPDGRTWYTMAWQPPAVV